MKKKRFYPAMALFFIILVVLVQPGISCNKDDNDNNNTQDCSVTTKGLAGTYMLTKVEAQVPGQTAPSDITDIILNEACLKDNTITLNSDGTVKYEDKGTACSPSASTNGTWTLNGQQISLTLNQSPFPIDLATGTVSSYDCKTLVVTTNINVPGSPIPVSVPAKATLTKQ